MRTLRLLYRKLQQSDPSFGFDSGQTCPGPLIKLPLPKGPLVPYGNGGALPERAAHREHPNKRGLYTITYTALQ
eukprot:1089252-Amphidinium_carterae.1